MTATARLLVVIVPIGALVAVCVLFEALVYIEARLTKGRTHMPARWLEEQWRERLRKGRDA